MKGCLTNKENSTREHKRVDLVGRHRDQFIGNHYNVLMVRLLLAFISLSSFAQSLKHPIAAIDFYGSASVDLVQLRAAFPYRVGAQYEPVKEPRLADLPLEFQRLVGQNKFSCAPILVPNLHGWVFYVDIEPASSAPRAWKKEPSGTVKLPQEIVALYEHAMDRMINGGLTASDETAEGYSLSKDPIMRADELKLIDYARAHPAVVYRVLEDSAARHDRIAAAWIAGYTPKGKDQITALLGAVNDPDSTVRNNSIRVLAVLAEHDLNLARQIPAESFIPMLNSLTWTDRNKAMFVLEPITAGRDPKTLESLRREATDALRQMSQWTYWGHASMALTLLGRVNGIPEDRLQDLIKTRNATAIFNAAAR